MSLRQRRAEISFDIGRLKNDSNVYTIGDLNAIVMQFIWSDTGVKKCSILSMRFCAVPKNRHKKMSFKSVLFVCSAGRSVGLSFVRYVKRVSVLKLS